MRSKALVQLANSSTVGTLIDGGTDDGTVTCQAGEHAIGGGARIAQAGKDQAIATSRPTAAGTVVPPADGTSAVGWRTVVADSGGDVNDNPSDVTVFAICAS